MTAGHEKQQNRRSSDFSGTSTGNTLQRDPIFDRKKKEAGNMNSSNLNLESVNNSSIAGTPNTEGATNLNIESVNTSINVDVSAAAPKNQDDLARRGSLESVTSTTSNESGGIKFMDGNEQIDTPLSAGNKSGLMQPSPSPTSNYNGNNNASYDPVTTFDPSVNNANNSSTTFDAVTAFDPAVDMSVNSSTMVPFPDAVSGNNNSKEAGGVMNSVEYQRKIQQLEQKHNEETEYVKGKRTNYGKARELTYTVPYVRTGQQYYNCTEYY
jgi:hypothetical protein